MLLLNETAPHMAKFPVAVSGFKTVSAGPVAGLPRPVLGPNNTCTGDGPAGVAGAAPPGATRFWRFPTPLPGLPDSGDSGTRQGLQDSRTPRLLPRHTSCSLIPKPPEHDAGRLERSHR